MSTYFELQAKSGLKPGDRVKVVRRPGRNETFNGWRNCWVPRMDTRVGGVFEIAYLTDSGVYFKGRQGTDLGSSLGFPFQVLKKVASAERTELTVREVIRELRKYNRRHPEHQGMISVQLFDDRSGNILGIANGQLEKFDSLRRLLKILKS